jgi:hypothetical protein
LDFGDFEASEAATRTDRGIAAARVVPERALVRCDRRHSRGYEANALREAIAATVLKEAIACAIRRDVK